jgi:NADPH2 dehydrogenase
MEHMAGLFDSYILKGLTLKNRVMMSPMCQYSTKEDGKITDWHYVHYTSRAVGGVGFIVMESSAVEPRGRITMHDVGIWSDDHIEGLKSIVDACKQYGVKMGIQLGHAGTKADTDEPNVAPSAFTLFDRYGMPTELTKAEIADIVRKFADATVRALKAGFDTVELHGAHGYLINQFLSPITNKRTDEYGGSLENRVRFALEVIRAVKAVLPEEAPLLMRVSAVEYSDEGYSMEEMIEMVKLFKAEGVDMVDVSSGGNVPHGPAEVFPGYQLQYADAIRNGADIPTIAVGMLDHPALMEEAVRTGRADVIAVARGLLRDPYLAKKAALELGAELEMPKQYARAF